MRNKYVLILMVLFNFCVLAQKNNFTIPDSLSSKDYNYFDLKINYDKRDSIRERLYAQSWLAKAKSEKNYSQMASAYKTFIYLYDKKWRFYYADKVIFAAKKSGNLELIGASFMTKGIVCYDGKKLMEALDNYIVANRYISESSNDYLIFKVKYCIAQTKFYLGFYDEAIALFKECEVYFKEENKHAYVNSLHSLGLCYTRLGKFQLSSQLNKTGLSNAEHFGVKEIVPYFLLSEGINQYFIHNYEEAEKKIKAALPEIISNKDFANEIVADFYIGKIFWAQNQKEKALPYFKKVDDAFQKKEYIRPDLREAYELIIEYYVNKNNQEAQLIYINKLLKVDRVLETNFKYLSGKIFKEYDTQKLVTAKKEIEKDLLNRTVIAFVVVLIMALIIVILIYKHYKNKRLFDELMQRQPEVMNSIILNDKKETELDINHEVVTTILQKLEKFEKNKKYLEKEMNLAKLALLLNTNTKYISKIIMKYRNKGTIDYVSDLKIDHIVELLKSEKKYRNYTNKALGEEAGFGSTQNFTRAFNSRTGISPSYFIKELNKSKPAD